MTTFISDTFTEGSNTSLSNHTPEVGGAWVKRSGSADLEVKTADNTLVPTGSVVLYTNAAIPPGVEYNVEASWEAGSGSNREIGLAGRFQDTSNQYQAFYTNDRYQLFKFVLGSSTKLEELIESPPSFPAAIKFEIKDATKKYLVDAAEKLSSADNSLTLAGLAGIRMKNSNSKIDTYIASDTGTPAAENASLQPMRVWYAR